jgi:hypothetical protein
MMSAIRWSNTLRGVGFGLFAGAEAFVAFAATLALPMAFAASCAALVFFAGLFGPFGVSGMTHIPHVELIAV